jgi:hypothetical protein
MKEMLSSLSEHRVGYRLGVYTLNRVDVEPIILQQSYLAQTLIKQNRKLPEESADTYSKP